MLTPTNSGRALEISPDGKLIWEFQNVFDESRNSFVKMAMLVPEDFFAADALTCPATTPSASGESGGAR